MKYMHSCQVYVYTSRQIFCVDRSTGWR